MKLDRARNQFWNRKGWEDWLIEVFLYAVVIYLFVVMITILNSQMEPSRREQVQLQVLSEKYPDTRNLLYFTDDNGYALTDLMGRALLIGGDLTLQGDYRPILRDDYPSVFESPFYGLKNKYKTCPYPNALPVTYDAEYDVSRVDLTDYVDCYVIPKKIGKLFLHPIDIKKTYELAGTGTKLLSAWAENNKVYYSISCNKGYDWGPTFQIPGSDDGYLPLVANDSSKLYVIWLKVYSTNFAEAAYVETDISTIGCAGIAWTPVATYTRSVCYLTSPLHGLCDDPKVKEYDRMVWSYVAYCQERVPTYFSSSICTADKRVLDKEYRYTNLPSIFKEKKDYNYYLSKLTPRYRIDLSYADETTKAERTYGSEKIGGGLLRDSAAVEFTPPAGFSKSITMRMKTE